MDALDDRHAVERVLVAGRLFQTLVADDSPLYNRIPLDMGYDVSVVGFLQHLIIDHVVP